MPKRNARAGTARGIALHCTPGGTPFFGRRDAFLLRTTLPYGQWSCADGREVLFNRFYEPLLARQRGQPAEAANPSERVVFIKQIWFYGDATPPESVRSAAREVFARWGLPTPEAAHPKR